jgi:hypothetical protein
MVLPVESPCASLVEGDGSTKEAMYPPGGAPMPPMAPCPLIPPMLPRPMARSVAGLRWRRQREGEGDGVGRGCRGARGAVHHRSCTGGRAEGEGGVERSRALLNFPSGCVFPRKRRDSAAL